MKTQAKFYLLFLTLVWGISELFLRQKLAPFIHHSAVLVSIAASVIYLATTIFGKGKKSFFFIASIIIGTLLIKLLSIPIFGYNFTSIINSLFAITLEGIVFTVLFSIQKTNKIEIILLSTFFGSYISAFIFRTIGIHLYPCNYLLSFNGTNGIFNFLVYEGFTWATFSVIFVLTTFLILSLVKIIKSIKLNHN